MRQGLSQEQLAEKAELSNY